MNAEEDTKLVTIAASQGGECDKRVIGNNTDKDEEELSPRNATKRGKRRDGDRKYHEGNKTKTRRLADRIWQGGTIQTGLDGDTLSG